MAIPIGQCAECLQPIHHQREVPEHARRHQVGTGHLLVPFDTHCYFCHLLVHEPTDGRLLETLPRQWHWAHHDCIRRADNDRRL